MSIEKSNKCKSVTNDQKAAMIDFLKNHDELKRGNFRQLLPKQWEALSAILNSIPGPKKETGSLGAV